MENKITREHKLVLYMLCTVHKFVELGLMPRDAIKAEYRYTEFNKKAIKKVLKNFEPKDEEMYVVDLFVDDYYKNMIIGGIS